MSSVYMGGLDAWLDGLAALMYAWLDGLNAQLDGLDAWTDT